VKEKNTILIYEKDLKLNQILKEQISKLNTGELYNITDEKKLQNLLESIKVNILILNLNQLNENIKNIIENHKFNKSINNLLGYYNKNYPYSGINENEIKVLEKPFKIIDIVNKIENLLSPKTLDNSNILLMNHLKFLPYEKVLINLKTKNKEHLTEKENKLLLHFYINKNIEITKNNLLNVIWGISENINTHTLETHIYRLKQKLYNVEPQLSFQLSNNNGLYAMQFKDDL
jgi:DNA-binding response OmpR family regulator